MNRPAASGGAEVASMLVTKSKPINSLKPNGGIPLSQLSSGDKDFDEDLDAFIGEGNIADKLGGKPNKKRKLNQVDFGPPPMQQS